ncbi:Ig-like domain-containing protein [Vibrio gigantis]|uniref:DUF4165 domain-containing protein n=1 Tax=Vibrio gigantis TaxID=296199 RepID=A0A5M9NYX2_9VIBR|nr:Ig-like domain-containing protein [Vibrio gigantis]KAA8675655.1 DUF4165 domain-containing protein [Vibrio gigantis]
MHYYWKILSGLLVTASTNAVSQVQFIEIDNQNTKVSVEDIFAPAHNNIKFHIISGLDRQVTVDMTSQHGTINRDLGVVGIRDSLEINAEKFYGKSYDIGQLAQGQYSIKVSQYDTTGQIMSTTHQQLTVDTVAPTLGSLFWNSMAYKLQNVPNNQWLGDFEVWNWGVTGVNDQLSGIDTIKVYATDKGSTTPLKSPIEISYNPSTKEARQGGAPAIFPSYEREYTIHIDAYDKAGNIGKMTRDITWTGQGIRPELVGVNDGTYSGNFLAGSPYNGYKAYTPGMAVGNYNFSLVYRLPYEWANPANPGRLYSYWGHFNTTEFVKDGYAYFSVSTVYSKGDPRTHEIPIGRHDRWVSYFLYHDLNLAPHLAKQPVAIKQEYFVNGVGWVNYNHHMLGLHNQHDIPTQFRVTTEPRPYNQRVFIQEHGAGGGYSNCVIPANQTTCQAPLPTQYVDWNGVSPSVPTGTIYFRHFWMNKIVKDDFRSLKSSNLGGMNFTLDKSLPKITTAKKVPFTNEFEIYALKDFAGEDWNRIQMSKVGLKVTDSSGHTQNVWVDGDNGHFSLNGQIVPLGDAFMSKSIPLPTLAAGTYEIELLAQDTAMNTTSRNLGSFQYEPEPPVVNLSTIDNLPLQGAMLTNLNQILIKVQDTSQYLVESVRLNGGGEAVKDEFELKLIDVALDKYAVETPRVFPTLIENEWYSLTVAVRDELGNQAIATSRFKYVPENIIELGTLVTLPVDSVLYTTNTNTPVTAVIFNPMTVEGGQMASGLHDYYITVGSQSTLPISVDGFEIGPGESKLLSVDFGNGDEQIIIPVSARGGEIGTSNIMVEIPQLKSKYN